MAQVSANEYKSLCAQANDMMKKPKGDCDNAVPLQEYKKQNPWFLDKISDAEITRENIAQMDNKLFSMYEPEIDNRMHNNEIQTSLQLASGGNIYVEWYTRGDGTKVSGYYRRA